MSKKRKTTSGRTLGKKRARPKVKTQKNQKKKIVPITPLEAGPYPFWRQKEMAVEASELLDLVQ